MNRLALIDPVHATGRTAELLGAVQQKLGRVPNILRVLANSPAALEAYLGLSAALESSSLSGRLREQIALAVAEINACGYCLSAHTAIAGRLGLSEAQIQAARRAEAEVKRDAATLKLVREIVLRRGEIRDGDLLAAREAGISDSEIADILVAVTLNLFTNYLNHVARTPVDFPEVQPGPDAPATPSPTSCAPGGGC